jgi:arabinogalactan endo-1,4-beta-galactosidase
MQIQKHMSYLLTSSSKLRTQKPKETERGFRMKGLHTSSCLRRVAVMALLACGYSQAHAQYIVGADVGYVKQAQDAGTVFKDNGQPKPVLDILHEHGYNWVRLRLFVEPTVRPNTLAYTIASAKMAKAAGFKILLDLHYSDNWADPGKQHTPDAWAKLSHQQLCDQVFSYTRDTIAAFRDAGVLPDMVQIGNEITHGMLWPDGRLPENWANFTDLLKAGINGVDAGHGNQARPLIMIHIDRGGDWKSTHHFFDQLELYDVRYDVIGQSYHPWWQGSLNDLRNNLYHMAITYHKIIVLAEVSYPWKPFAKQNDNPPFPLTAAGQADWLRALNQVIQETPDHLGGGLFWWEPAVRPAQPLHGRDLFGDDGNALPAISVFDAYTRK